jgi:hypothetical protein
MIGLCYPLYDENVIIWLVKMYIHAYIQVVRLSGDEGILSLSGLNTIGISFPIKTVMGTTCI